MSSIKTLILPVIMLLSAVTAFSQCPDGEMHGSVEGNYFGQNCAYSWAAGSPAYVFGTPSDNEAGTGAGKVWFYDEIYDGAWLINEITGETEGDRFGHAVAGSDSGVTGTYPYGHFVVGAPFHNVMTGKVYIYDQSWDDTPLFTLDGETMSDWFGWSVAVGDLDNDNVDEVVVGAPFNDAGGVDAGRVYVYSEGSLDYTIDGTVASGAIGYSVAVIGDFDGDGYNDIAVGAYEYTASAAGDGRAFVYSGTDGAYITHFDGDGGSQDRFGWSIASAGDINDDGRCDLIVGATQYFSNGTGYVKVFSGLDHSTLYSFYGEANGDRFGNGAAAADMNYDGTNDIIIGAPGNDGFSNNAGRVYAYSGTDGSLIWAMDGESSQDGFGSSVEHINHYFSRGYDYIAVGAIWSSELASNGGAVYQYHAHEQAAPGTFAGDNPHDEFGYSVCGAGDVNNDGYDDIIIGAPHYFTYDSQIPYANVYSGADSSLLMHCIGDLDTRFGWSVSGAGDVNNDGFDDVIVGTYDMNAGAAYLYYGGSTPDATADAVFTSLSPYRFGDRVSGAGDVNNDGFDDILIADGGQTDTPSLVYLYYGGPLSGSYTTADADFTISESEEGLFLRNPASLGDFDNDGYDDFAVSSLANSDLVGEVYIFRGGLSLTGTVAPGDADIVITGDHIGDRFGWSLSGIGDFDGDGYGDLLASTSVRGKAWIFYLDSGYMAPSMYASDADLIIESIYGYERDFGQSTGGYADVNGDGLGDAIIGEPGDDWSHLDFEGNVYVFYGGSGLSGTVTSAYADRVYSGVGEYDEFGMAVSGAGDTDDDGDDDIIVGSKFYAGRCIDAGQAFLFTDDPPSTGNCCLDWILPGDANDDLAINLLDILDIIAYVYQDPVGDPPNPHGCDALLDCNGDGTDVENPAINLLDILTMIEHVYQDPVGYPALCCPPGCQMP